jgi:hypothetical protein
MEKFMMTIKRRVMLFSGMAIAAAALGIYSFLVICNSEKTGMTDGIIAGFQFGLILGIGLLALLQIIRLIMVIRDDKKLKILYNKEHDERLKAIRSKAGMPMLLINSIIMLIAAIIAGYFNITVFFTLVIASMVQLSIGTIVKLYCMKTM